MWRPADLDPTAGSKTSQVAELIRRTIESGRLAVGSLLPSERELARRLEVSRVTVVRAIEELRARGLVETRHGFGSVVRPNDRLMDPVAPVPLDARFDLRTSTAAAPREVEQAAQDLVLGDRFRSRLTTDGAPAGGSWELREALAAHLTRQGVPTLPTQLTLVTGATAGLDLAIAALVHGPGRSITETPTYPGALAVLRRRGLDPVGWPAGVTGWDLDQATHLVRRARPAVMYVQPDNHSPTGQTMPSSRRAGLVDLARRHKIPLITDDTLRPLWLGESEQPPPLSRRRGVISVGSFAKSVWGGLLVGWVRASQGLTRAIQASSHAFMLRPSATDELLAMAVLDHFDTIVARRRRLLRTNLDALTAALADVPGVTWHQPTGGMTLWLDLGPCDAHEVATAAATHGLLIAPGDSCTSDASARNHLRFPYTAAPDQLRGAVAVLAELSPVRRQWTGPSTRHRSTIGQ